jgi:hypothetical protein
MSTQVLLLWLVAYTGILAACGFILVVARGFSGRAWSNGAILRTSSLTAFVLTTALWVLLLLAA